MKWREGEGGNSDDWERCTSDIALCHRTWLQPSREHTSMTREERGERRAIVYIPSRDGCLPTRRSQKFFVSHIACVFVFQC